MRNRLMSLVLAVSIILGSSIPVWAAEKDVLENGIESDAQANADMLDEHNVPEIENEFAGTQENAVKEENSEEQVKIERSSDSELFSEIDANGLKWEVADGVLKISGNGVIEQNSSFTSNDELRESITSIIINDSITEIGDAAFEEYRNLKDIIIPDSVRKIGVRAFLYCGLESVSLPYGLTEIKYNTFTSCRALSKIIIPDSVTTIGDSAFSGCTGLIKVTIPSSVKSIGETAFGGCSGLRYVIFQGNAPEIARGAEIGPFYGVTATAYYPMGNQTYTDGLRTGRYEGNMTWEAREPLKIILEATDDTYKIGSSEEATITCNGVWEDFESLNIDGNKVDESNYTSEKGSTIINLNTSYLDTLTIGKHVVTLNYIYGSIDAELTVISEEEDKIPLRIILETTKNTHVLGTSDTATITCTGELKDFVNVYVEGGQVDRSNYTLAEGSTILTFTAQYLNTLSVGTHAVTLNYTYGSVDTELIILSSENTTDTANTSDSQGTTGGANDSGKSGIARTGDRAAVLLWLLTAMTAVAVSVGTVFIRRKHSIFLFYKREDKRDGF